MHAHVHTHTQRERQTERLLRHNLVFGYFPDIISYLSLMCYTHTKPISFIPMDYIVSYSLTLWQPLCPISKTLSPFFLPGEFVQ
jgi:hypothetical protein